MSAKINQSMTESIPISNRINTKSFESLRNNVVITRESMADKPFVQANRIKQMNEEIRQKNFRIEVV